MTNVHCDTAPNGYTPLSSASATSRDDDRRRGSHDGEDPLSSRQQGCDDPSINDISITNQPVENTIVNRTLDHGVAFARSISNSSFARSCIDRLTFETPLPALDVSSNNQNQYVNSNTSIRSLTSLGLRNRVFPTSEKLSSDDLTSLNPGMLSPFQDSSSVHDIKKTPSSYNSTLAIGRIHSNNSKQLSNHRLDIQHMYITSTGGTIITSSDNIEMS